MNFQSLSYDFTSSMSCSLKVNSPVVDHAPYFVICKSSGYIYEIKGQKIIKTLKLNNENPLEIFCAFLVENNKLLTFYVVHTVSNKLYIIKRRDTRLEVVKIHYEVANIDVDDYQCLGYPQIGSKSSFYVNFPVTFKEVENELACETNLKAVSKSLAEKLQIIYRHIDELTEEVCNMWKLCTGDSCNETFDLIPLKLSSPIEKYTENITVTAKWVKVIDGTLILGLKIQNNGEGHFFNFEFQIYNKIIKDYSYRFFSPYNLSSNENQFFLHEVNIPTIQRGKEITIIGAVPLSQCNFAFIRNLQISCCLFSEKFKNCVLTETFEINICDVIDNCQKFSSQLNLNHLAEEDLQAIKTVKLETKLKIETNCFSWNQFENFFDSFEFIKIDVGCKFYYSKSSYLSEVFFAVFEPSESVCKLVLYTRDEPQLFIMVNFFYGLFPEGTSIVLLED